MAEPAMRHVRCTTPGPHFNKTAIMHSDGKVQLDGPREMWRGGATAFDALPLCFGWHDMPDLTWETDQ